jgi:signal transduction histidine kinase
MKTSNILFGILFVFTTSYLYSQETVKNIDSILIVLNETPADTSKVNLFRKIAGHYNVAHLDSAKAFAEEGIVLAKQLDYTLGHWENLNVLGNYYERKTDYESALKNYNAALELVETANSIKGFAVVKNNIATIYIHKGEYQKAIPLMFEALKAEEILKNENGIAQAYNNIGVVYYYLQDFDKTTDYLTKALVIQEGLGNYDGLINGYNNVGAIHIHQEKYHEAIEDYEKALLISTKIDDKVNQAIELSNIGICWTKLGDFAKAEEFYSQSLAIRDHIEDTNGKANSLVNMGELFIEQRNYAKAEDYLNQGLALATQNDLKKIKEAAFAGLSEVYEGRGDFKRSIAYLKDYIKLKDSILNEDNARVVAEAETKYETEKKENEILKQQVQLAEKDLVVRRKNTVIYSGFGLVLLVGLLGYLFYNQQKLKNSQLQKEGELKSALVKIETQNKLQEQRLRISRDLHDNIGSQLTFIISSIDNLKYGFKDMGDKLSGKLSGISGFTSQTTYELRDTIWAMNKNNITFEDLQARISNFIDNAKIASEKTKFNFDIDSNVNVAYLFTSVEGMNIYRIIQEAVNNALKYSEASEITVNISDEENSFIITIIDNGKGFDIEITDVGNGFLYMKKRGREIGATIEINSVLSNGTAVVVEVPIKSS